MASTSADAVLQTPLPCKRAAETDTGGVNTPVTALKKSKAMAATAASVEAALHDAVDNIESKFATMGCTPLSSESGKGATLRLKGGESFQFPMSSDQAATALAPLLKAATPSAFGHGSETVVDMSVRKASELRPDAFDFEFSPSNELLEQVRTALVPDAGAVRADLHKLNVMKPGDFFLLHKDTPRGASTCFGTLVVSLPVPFQGGRLRFVHHEHSALAAPLNNGYSRGYYGSSAEKCAFVPQPVAQWVAFFGDVQHEVERVISGHRLTLTYVLHRDAEPDPSVDMLLQRASGVHKALTDALECADFMPDGGSLGVYCKHEYEEKVLSQADALLAAGGKKAYVSKLSGSSGGRPATSAGSKVTGGAAASRQVCTHYSSGN